MCVATRLSASLISAALLFGLCSSALQAQVPQEQVEAAYLSKFARYVTWPRANSDNRALQICIVGQDPFRRSLDKVAGSERIFGRPISIRRVVSARGAENCHIAYVQGATPAETRTFLNDLSGHPVLTVTSARGGSPQGIIHFLVRGERVRFYIDDARAARSGLTISSRLLKLALAVNREPS